MIRRGFGPTFHGGHGFLVNGGHHLAGVIFGVTVLAALAAAIVLLVLVLVQVRRDRREHQAAASTGAGSVPVSTDSGAATAGTGTVAEDTAVMPAAAAPGKTALDVLQERYARGEIDKAEYEQKKQDLSS